MPIVEYPDSQWYLRFWHKSTHKITKIPIYPFITDGMLYQHIHNIHKHGKTYHESQDIQLEFVSDETREDIAIQIIKPIEIDPIDIQE